MTPSQVVALVTGANRGIGREISRQLASQGMRVILCARRLADAERAVSQLDLPSLVPLQLDVTQPPADLASRIEADHGRLDVLVRPLAAGGREVDLVNKPFAEDHPP